MRHLSQWTFWGRHEAFILSLILTLTFTLIPKIRALITTPIRWQLFSSVGGIPLWPHVDRLWCWSSTIICLHWWLWAILGHIAWMWLRDRPFNLKVGGGGGYGFLFRSEFFFPTTQELEYLFFLSREAQFFFPEFNIRLYDKNSESHFFFPPPPKSEYFFQQHWESEYFFRKNP